MSKKAKKTTALVRLKKKPVPTKHLVRFTAPQGVVPEVLPAELPGMLGDDAAIGNLGLVEIKLTDHEERVLAEPVNAAKVLIKPTGQPYLPHAEYTRWFGRAFGRVGFAVVPKAKAAKLVLPAKKEGETSTRYIIAVPYVLYVHGKPVAFAQGGQEYNETNREQSYDDAIEATVASALRRFAKRLGVGLELWDRDWLNAWIAEYAVPVETRNGNYATTQWRRKIDPPLKGETRVGKVNRQPDVVEAEFEQAPAPRPQHPPRGNDGNGNELITRPQRQRMAMIAKNAGRIDAEVRLWLKKRWGYEGSGEVKRKDYDAICKALEAKGDLQMPGDGQ